MQNKTSFAGNSIQKTLSGKLLPFAFALLPLVSVLPAAHAERADNSFIAVSKRTIKTKVARVRENQAQVIRALENFIRNPSDESKMEFLRVVRTIWESSVIRMWHDQKYDSITSAYVQFKQMRPRAKFADFINAVQAILQNEQAAAPLAELDFAYSVQKLRNRILFYGRLINSLEEQHIFDMLGQQFGNDGNKLVSKLGESDLFRFHYNRDQLVEMIQQILRIEPAWLDRPLNKRELEINRLSKLHALEMFAFLEQNGLIADQGWQEWYKKDQHQEQERQRAIKLKEEAGKNKLRNILTVVGAVIAVGIAIPLLYKLAKIIRRIRGERMKKKQEEMDKEVEKLVYEYAIRIDKMRYKLKEAKTLEELDRMNDKCNAIYDEIKKKYSAKMREEIYWALVRTSRSFNHTYESWRFEFTGKRGWRS